MGITRPDSGLRGELAQRSTVNVYVGIVTNDTDVGCIDIRGKSISLAGESRAARRGEG